MDQPARREFAERLNRRDRRGQGDGCELNGLRTPTTEDCGKEKASFSIPHREERGGKVCAPEEPAGAVAKLPTLRGNEGRVMEAGAPASETGVELAQGGISDRGRCRELILEAPSTESAKPSEAENTWSEANRQ